ncbi:hypothetical protein ACEPPN_019359 [Leptodophora sp. 'Broadleaf-Isolate-01']
MATFAFKPQYTYKPTPPRSKSTATRRKPAPEQISILNKLQHIMSSGASLSTPRPAAAAAADDDGDYRPGIRGTGTIYGRSDKANDDENDDDRDFPIIEELLLTKLQEQGFTTEDRGPDRTGGVEGVASEERGGSVDQSRSAQSDDSGGSPDDPIFLLGDDDSSASAAEADDVSLRAESTEPEAGLFDSPENAVDSTTLAPRSSDGWHDIDDFPETAPRLQLAEQGALTSNSIYPHTPSSRLSSEPLHDSMSMDSKATTPFSSPPPRHCRASPETQLSQECRLHTGRGVADEHELVDHTLDTLLIDEGARKQQEVEQEQEKDEGNSEDEDEGPQQEMNVMSSVVTAEMAGGSLRLANRRQSLPNLDPSLEPSHNEAGSRSGGDSDDELNSTDSAKDDEKKPRPAKRKQLSSSHDGPTGKKRRRLPRESSSRHRRPLSKPHRQYLKSHSPLDQCSRVATSSSGTGRLPSPAPAMPQSIDTKMSLGNYNLSPSSRATLPTLTEITFRPHSAHCYSFTATIQDGCDGPGLSLGQVVRLITSIGHVGKIDDFTIKPMEQHSYLLSGFSYHPSSRLSSSGTALSTTAEAGRDHVDATRPGSHHGRAVDARALASRRCEPSSSNDDGGLSDSDPDVSSDDDGCSSARMNIPWDPVDEQRLVAWKKEGKPWNWILKKLPGRTESAVRQRVSIVKNRGK